MSTSDSVDKEGRLAAESWMRQQSPIAPIYVGGKRNSDGQPYGFDYLWAQERVELKATTEMKQHRGVTHMINFDYSHALVRNEFIWPDWFLQVHVPKVALTKLLLFF